LLSNKLGEKDLSNKNIILFDGECALCNRFIVFVIKQDKKQVFHFSSLQSEVGKSIAKVYGINDVSTIVFVSEESAKTKSLAVLSIFSYLTFPYHLLNIFYLVPYFLRDELYDLVARYRYNIFGRNKTCYLYENEDWKERVL